jgi:hypothetical protein
MVVQTVEDVVPMGAAVGSTGAAGEGRMTCVDGAFTAPASWTT